MIRKYASPKYLDKLIVPLEDTSALSPNYFNILEYPEVLQAGKNLLRIQGSQNLEINTPISIEVLDFNGNPVYYEVSTVLDNDGSRVVSIWIYPETAPGIGRITLVGTARVDFLGNPVPASRKQTPNLRWSKQISIAPTTNNSSEIIFNSVPVISIQEIKKPLFTSVYTGGRFLTASSTATCSYSHYNNTTILEADSTVFSSLFQDATVIISSSAFTSATPTNLVPISVPSFYTASVKDVISSRQVVLSAPYSVSTTTLQGYHTYRKGTINGFTVEYEANPTLEPVTQSSLIGGSTVTASYAQLTIENLDPVVGDVGRIQVYLKSISSAGNIKPYKGYTSPGSYVKVADTLVQTREVLIDTSGSQELVDRPIGAITSKAYFDKHWTVSGSFPSVPGTVTIVHNRTLYPLLDAFEIVSVSGEPATFTDNDYYYIRTSNSFSFEQGVVYTLTFDAVSQTDSAFNATAGYYLLDTVLSGSACVDTHLNISNAKLIGSIKTTEGFLHKNQSFDFTVPRTGTAQLMFLLRAGKWNIANMSIRPRQELGFTPNKFEIVFPIESYRNDTFDIKVEYCDYLGNRSKTISEVKNFSFTPTPLRINQVYADNVVSNITYASASIITGSLHVTGSVYYNGRKQYNFGQFYDTTTQSGSRNTPYAMKLNTTDISQGVSITNNVSGSPTQITVDNTGYYNLQFSSQLYNSNNSNLLFTIWFRVNGVDIPNSSTNVEVTKAPGSNGQLVAAWNFLYYLTASQYMEIMWSYYDGSDSGQILYVPSSSLVPFPATPSVIATMTQVA